MVPRTGLEVMFKSSWTTEVFPWPELPGPGSVVVPQGTLDLHMSLVCRCPRTSNRDPEDICGRWRPSQLQPPSAGCCAGYAGSRRCLGKGRAG